jgi:small subunit ribosomal protein S13
MTRLAGVSVPGSLQARYALAHVFGIGDTTARRILKDACVPETTVAGSLGRNQVDRINAIIDTE